MAKPRNVWIDRLQYAGLRVVSMLFNCWPVDWNLQAASLVGDGVYFGARKYRERAIGNLRRSFPDKSDAQIRALARRSMQQLFMLFVEVFHTPRLIHIHTWAKYVELENLRDVMALLLTRNQGVIMVTAHYGNFEMAGYVLATMGFETHSVFRPLDNALVDAWLRKIRGRKGQKIIAKKGATEEVVEVLQRGGAVGFVADQNAGGKGLFVDFFGRKASTYKSIGLLAMEFNAAIVVGYARRIGDRFRFKVGVQDIIRPADWQDQADPLRYITQRYTSAVEQFIRADPSQYWWVHRRWKTRPKGELPEQFD
jgi:Kdo2-lipid IVA lauroyltransferase/acyltransferase